MRPRTTDQLRHRYGILAAVVAAVILLGSAGVLALAFTTPAAGASLVVAPTAPGAIGAARQAPGTGAGTQAGARTTNPRPGRDGGPAASGSPATGHATAAAGATAAETGTVGSPGEGPTSGATATGLDPELLRRFETARTAARADGVTLTLTSGWRSAAEQERIIAAGVARYGSVAEARRWVLPPDTSAHVQGEAIDVGPASGATWLGLHGSRFGLCRTYANEPWHFEPAIAPGGTCPPPPHADSSWGW